jgi:hypothetical protein
MEAKSHEEQAMKHEDKEMKQNDSMKHQGPLAITWKADPGPRSSRWLC